MSDQVKKERTVDEIQKDAYQTTLTLGDATYRKHCIENDIKMFLDKLRDLNFEFVSLDNKLKAEAAEKAKAEVKVEEVK